LRGCQDILLSEGAVDHIYQVVTFKSKGFIVVIWNVVKRELERQVTLALDNNLALRIFNVGDVEPTVRELMIHGRQFICFRLL